MTTEWSGASTPPEQQFQPATVIGNSRKRPVTPLEDDADSSKRVRKRGTFECSHLGCSHKGTFLREYELERHIKTKHEKDRPFQCPVTGCFKRTQRTAFARSD